MSFGTPGFSGFTGAKAPAPGPATTVPISGLLAATGTNNINNAALTQTWNWANLNGNNGLALQLNQVGGFTNSGGAGGVGTAIDKALLNIYATGTTNATGYFVNLPFKIKNDATGSTAFTTNYGIAAEVTGAAATNVGSYFYASGAQINYAIIVPENGGFVGFGTIAPEVQLHVNGDMTVTNGIVRTPKAFINCTIASTFYYPAGDAYTKLSLEDESATVQTYSPLLNFKTKADAGILWQHNPKDISSIAMPFSFNYGIGRNVQPGIDDMSYTFGYNYNTSGGRIDLTGPQFGESWEQKYEVSQHGQVVENYQTMTAIDGTTCRPYYYIANRDTLSNSSYFFSADHFLWQTGVTGAGGSMDFSPAKAAGSGTLLQLSPGTGVVNPDCIFQLNGTVASSNKIKMVRPTGATGAGTLDLFVQYLLATTTPTMSIGPENNTSKVNIAGGQLGLGIFGSGNPAIFAPISYPTVHIGRITSQHGANELSVMQINFNQGYFYELNTGIDAWDALRFNNTSGKKWSFGADTAEFYLNNTTDTLRIMGLTNAGILNIGRLGGTTAKISIGRNSDGLESLYLSPGVIGNDNGAINFNTGSTTAFSATSTGYFASSRRVQMGLGANVASANNLTLGADGNSFHITGNTQINAITTTGWQAGSVIHLIFDSTPTVKNNTAGGAGTAVLLLALGVDFLATANDVLTLLYDGTSWFEVCRSVN